MTDKEKASGTLTSVCFLTFAVLVIAVWGVNRYKNFSSPSSETVASDKSATRLCRVTAYCPCETCCGKWADGITASGLPAVGKIAAASSTIPFGTVLDIPGYGVASVQDRGGAITGNRLDVLFATHAEAKAWGVQYLMVQEMK